MGSIEKKKLWIYWFLPIISLMLQFIGGWLLNLVVPHQVEDLRGMMAFWVVYFLYIVVVLLYSYLYLGVLIWRKRPYNVVTIVSISFFSIFIVWSSCFTRNNDFLLTSIILSFMLVMYFFPFYYGVRRIIGSA